MHKESGQVLAIKQVPVDTDLQEIIKEISIMQQCDSPYVVKYYGSYFKNTDLWVSGLPLLKPFFSSSFFLYASHQIHMAFRPLQGVGYNFIFPGALPLSE